MADSVSVEYCVFCMQRGVVGIRYTEEQKASGHRARLSQRPVVS